MKWFIRVLKHYADFSGRARRKEYWYFALFSSMAAIAVVVIDIFAGWNIVSYPATRLDSYSETGSYPVPDLEFYLTMYLPNFSPCFLAYVMAMLLPGLAVAVRRLHDLGKSGWWMLTSLIPVVGAIWLFVLFCTKGQRRPNRYGTKSKSVKQHFSGRRREKSIAVAFIVSAVVELGSFVSNWIRYDFLTNVPSWVWLMSALAIVSSLFFGLFYYPADDPDKTAKRRKVAFILLAIALLITFIRNIENISALTGYAKSDLIWFWANLIVSILLNLILLVLIVLLLFKPKRKKMAPVAILLIVLTVVSIVISLVWTFVVQSDPWSFAIIGNIAVILLAAHCLHRRATERPA
jgi:uncharacterized membrane protein YhaH (DUF805 family)